MSYRNHSEALQYILYRPIYINLALEVSRHIPQWQHLWTFFGWCQIFRLFCLSLLSSMAYRLHLFLVYRLCHQSCRHVPSAPSSWVPYNFWQKFNIPSVFTKEVVISIEWKAYTVIQIQNINLPIKYSNLRLIMVTGDLMEILSRDQGDWWMARHITPKPGTRREGYIPSNYVAQHLSLNAEV